MPIEFGMHTGGCLGGKGVRRGEGVFELAAKGSALLLVGSIAKLAGSDANRYIGLPPENLRLKLVLAFLNQRWQPTGDATRPPSSAKMSIQLPPKIYPSPFLSLV